MNFEVIKRSHIKRNILISVVVVLMLTAIILTFTKAKYKITESMPLVNGTINYELSDFNLIGAYIQEGDNYIQVNGIPTSGYEFNSKKSYCTVNNENINATLNYDMETQTLNVAPLTTKGTKCYLYFDEKASGGDYILAGDNPPTNSTTDWTGGTSYYYTGNPNNWVQFGGFWWRIIRINGDGTIRMIYQGTSANTTGTGTQLQLSSFSRSYNNKTYVGLVYDGTTQHGYGTNSTIMNTLNNWYNSNLTSYEADYIDTGTGFCSDRKMANGSSFDSSGTISYASYDRINGSASLQCHDDDILSQDNEKLPNPIGLITADEALFAGILWSGTNQNNYLYTMQAYWTMSPGYYDSTGAYVFIVNSNGNLYLNDGNVSNVNGVRPVINLRSNVQLTGSGTTSDPYVVVTS